MYICTYIYYKMIIVCHYNIAKKKEKGGDEKEACVRVNEEQ